MEPYLDNDGQLYFIEQFFSPQHATRIFDTLLTQLQWSSETIKMFGKSITVPRLVCWYGDKGANYRYSGIDHSPLPWTPALTQIKDSIERFSHQTFNSQTFNSVLANLYRNETDSMGWHADKEKELGKNPCIASVSLGEARYFHLRHNKSKKIYKLLLSHGSLLIMAGSLQHNWQHSVPKCGTEKKARINLTFRNIAQAGHT